MKVKDIMMTTSCYCRPEANLGAAAELMWNADCGFLPILSAEGKVIGVITDRDICIALGTRNCLAGELRVADAMSSKLYSCAPDDDIHTALQTMSEAKVRRLPVKTQGGALVGVLSINDLLFRAEPAGFGRTPDLSRDEIVRTLRSIARERTLMAHA
jgi:CBS domain-containing protein